ncbi:hypothetical protein BS47DRAFT_1312974 [Hydnum rufescens UP504]|uniref:MPN domain-containing protein n=1 Tax=Hydnum rufescens UP504 TaxID=1448309 RepID=A0A9P6B6Q3_9AGAM|nr:hypothetical protein BS47DRAFT_1312974 [Hydnum rufescens UP504]
MAPTGRLRSFEEIEELSKPTAYDPERSFKDQLRAIDTLRDQSFEHRQKGDLENAYIFMARAAGVVLDKLPFHSQYDILSAKQKTDLAANGQSMLRVLADLRPQLVERHRDYLASRSNGILPPPRNPKGHKPKGTASPPGEIQMPRTPTSIEDRSSRALTSSGPTPGVTVMLTEAQERERQGDRQRVRRMQSREASRSTREYNIPTPVPTPSRQEPPQLSQPHRYASHDEGNHHSDFEPSISRLQQSYDADFKPWSNDSGPLNETAQMRRALDLENTGVGERHSGEAQSRGIQNGGMPTTQREAPGQATLQEQRVANGRDILTRRPVDAQAPRQADAEAREKAEWDARAAERGREDQASREVQSRITREIQRRALMDAEIIERQRRATEEVQVKIAREPQDRVMREAASDLIRRDSQEQRMPRPSLDGGVRRADSLGHSQIPLQASYPVTREQSNPLSGHNLRQSLSSSGYPDTAAPLYPSQSASAHSSRLNGPGQIGIVVPASIPYSHPDPTAEVALPTLTLESPSHSRPYFLGSMDDGRGPSIRDLKRMYPSPIVTTTSPPRETGHIVNVPKAYPELMTTHQKEQGYQPSPQSIFAQSEPQEEDTPHALLFQPSWPSSRSMNPSPRPVQVLNMSSRSSPYPEYTGTAGPPPAPPFSHLLHGHPRSEPSVTPRLRQLMLPMSTLPRFLSVAAVNTAQKRETCGLLLGKPIGNSFRISTLLIPKQSATENTSTMIHEELVAQVQLTRDLITLGWIHTHPTQSCFMSSLDLHTHSGYQSSLPEAIAIVCAPKSTPNFGIFRLTDPPGLGMIQSCRNKAAFHPHSDSEPIYTDADSDHVKMVDDAYLEIIDLR